MTVILAIVGAGVGAVLSFGDFRGVALGIALGAIAGLLLDLRQRLTAVQRRAENTAESLRLLQEQVDRGLASGRARDAGEAATTAAARGVKVFIPRVIPDETENLTKLLTAIGEELKMHVAALGETSLQTLVGRTDLLEQIHLYEKRYQILIPR